MENVTTPFALQANLVTIAKSDEVNVFETVRWLRNKRRGLVADPEQYRFIYNVLEDYVVSGETQIEADRLRLQMAKLATAASPSPRYFHFNHTSLRLFSLLVGHFRRGAFPGFYDLIIYQVRLAFGIP